MNNDDELRSVRVEVGDGQPGGADAPVVEGSSSTRRGPLALGVVAVVLLVAAFVSLRPASDQTADGTERSAPSEEIAPVEETVPSEERGPESGAAEEEIDNEEAALPVSSADGLVLQRVDIEGDLWEVLPGETGFFGLSFDTSGQLFRSLDGVDWFPLEASFTSLEGSEARSMFWSNINTTPDGFLLSGNGQTSFETRPTRTFTSETGAEWTEIDLGGSADVGRLDTPVIKDDAVFGVVHGGPDRLDSFIGEYFDFDVPESQICEVSQEFVDVKAFVLTGCRGQRIGVLDETNVANPLIADQVLDCVADGSSWFYGQPSTLVRQERTVDGERTVLRELAGFNVPVVLASGDMAMFDLDSADREQLAVCEGLIDLPEPVEPSVVVFDSETEQVISWPTPNGIALEASLFGPTTGFLIGDTEVGGSLELLAYLDGELWALDPDSGAWRGPILGDLADADGYPVPFGLSESGTRVYKIDDRALRISEFAESSNGTLAVVETAMPFVEGFGPRQLTYAWFQYADDDVIFLRVDDEVWVLDIPEIRR